MNAFSGSSTAPGPPVSTSPTKPTAPPPTAAAAASSSSTGAAAIAPPGSSADPTTVTPVTPAAVQAAPSAALDKVAGEPTMLEKALGMAQPYLAKVDAVTHPYVEKVQATTKPYTDAAMAKAKEIADKIEGQGPAVSGTPTAAAAAGGSGATSITATSGEKTLGAATVPVTAGGSTFPGTSTASSTTAASGGFEDKIEAAVTNIGRRLSAVGTKIDEKTGSADHPGLFSRVMGAVGNITGKADSFIQSHAPHATNATSTVGHPVATTTNTVPHTDKPDAVPATAGAAPTSVISGPTPTATAGSTGAIVPP